MENEGSWSEEAAAFIDGLARARTRQAPAILQQSVAAALTARWSATLNHAAMTAFTAILLAETRPKCYIYRDSVDANP